MCPGATPRPDGGQRQRRRQEPTKGYSPWICCRGSKEGETLSGTAAGSSAVGRDLSEDGEGDGRDGGNATGRDSGF
jgi:hypothetical protein